MTATPDGSLSQTSNVARGAADDVEQALLHVREALRGLQFGVISIVVQDGVVLQIERTERTRMRRRGSQSH